MIHSTVLVCNFRQNPTPDLVTGLEKFSRQALHAGALGLSHPVTSETLNWKSPLPSDFADLAKTLAEDAEVQRVNNTALRWMQPDWPAPAHVHALTTERSASRPDDPYDGFNFADYVKDAPAKVAIHRETLHKTFGFLDPPTWLSQQHGNTVLGLDYRCETRVADGSFTNRDRTVCAVLSADCAPVFLCDHARVLLLRCCT